MGTIRRGVRIPAVTIAVLLFIVPTVVLAGCGSDAKSSSSTSAPSALSVASSALPMTVSVTVGTDSAPDRIEQIPLGSIVTLAITDPNADEEYHVHGYELGDGEAVAKGETKVFTFTADTAGTFEVESHTTETVLVQLVVG